MPKRKTSQPAEYVGYRHPPTATRFKTGKSGNPKGRPKGSRPVGSILRDIIEQKVSVTEGGKTRKIPALEVMFRRLANDAMRSDQKAIKLLLSLVDRYSESPEAKIELNEMLAEDEEILARYLPGGSNSCPSPERDDEGGDNGA
jgi:hypothetical protein